MPDILLVEDKDSLRHALRMPLENAGSGVTRCVDARSAIGEISRTYVAEALAVSYKTLLTKVKKYNLQRASANPSQF